MSSCSSLEGFLPSKLSWREGGREGGREGEREGEVGRKGEGGRDSGLTDLCFTT